MSITLNIEFEKNLLTEELVLQKKIPCLCRVSKDFEIVFKDPLPEAVGVVHGWDRAMLEQRAMAGAGGKYTHYGYGLLTLKSIKENVYEITDLDFFSTGFGWCQILIDSEYGPPGNFWDDDEEDTIGR